MPELPEVETLRRGLAHSLPGAEVRAVRVRETRLRRPVRTRRLRSRLVGRSILAVRRRSKYLLVDVEGDTHVVVHLGMSGTLELTPATSPLQTHVHVVLELDSGLELRYRDPRRFGLVDVLSTAELMADPSFTTLGPEPLSDTWRTTDLVDAARGRRVPVKAFLMDARVVVGVGNIYANEALYRAGVHPRRSAGRIAESRWERVHGAVREVLLEAIENRGTTLRDFHDSAGNDGGNAAALRVYGREGEACGTCARPIRRLVLGGRSTFYCPRCQR